MLMQYNKCGEFQTNLYRLEAEYCAVLHVDDCRASRIGQQISNLLKENFPGWDQYAQKSLVSIFNICNNFVLSGEMIKLLTNIDPSLLNDMSSDSFSRAKYYVQNLTGVELSQVIERELPNYRSSDVEAECVACGEHDHHVFYSPNSNQVSSTDLLCHELGHAVDFTFARRTLVNDRSLYRHSCLSECIAYYCQFSYLSQHGNATMRAGALAAFSYTYLAILVCQYCMINQVSLSQPSVDELLDDQIFQPFLQSFELCHSEAVSREFLKTKLNKLRSDYSDLGSLVYGELGPRLGIPLALILMNGKGANLESIARRNIITTELDELLLLFDSSPDTQFAQIEQLMMTFIGE